MYDWDNIIGNEQLKTMLIKSIELNNLSHAYLFDGPYGTGKKLIANTFAKAIFCKTKESNCKCHSCVSFDAGSHSDLVYIRPEKTKSVKVEDIREKAINDISKKPFEYNKKIYIIENADTMTPQAQNALLRSIEEPPEYVVFILLSDSIYSFLPTIISRCFICKVKPLPVSDVYEFLKQHGAYAKIAGEFSGGSIGAAVKLLNDEIFFEMRNTVNMALTSVTGKNDLADVFTEIKRFDEYKESADDVVILAYTWLRDVLTYKATKNKQLIIGYDFLPQISACAEAASFKCLYLMVDAIKELKRSLSANTSFGAALDAMAIKFAGSATGVGFHKIEELNQ